ncbi:hypothetical protein [Mycobacterium parascrofulaceum]|uniref:hypothetical protein n=1 Tax=Mycobacterium parascrofulaceum TaxID=240125 RepID=UPI001111F8D9|nr:MULTISPECIES: hypothetical protein [Mycobacterium]
MVGERSPLVWLEIVCCDGLAEALHGPLHDVARYAQLRGELGQGHLPPADTIHHKAARAIGFASVADVRQHDCAIGSMLADLLGNDPDE